MFAISISFGPNNAMMAFLYKSEGPFRTALEFAANKWRAGEPVHIADDFGQHGTYNPESIHAIFDEDLEQSMDASIERTLYNTRMQIKADDIGGKDPAIVEHYKKMQQRQRMAGIMAGQPNGTMPVTGPWPRV